MTGATARAGRRRRWLFGGLLGIVLATGLAWGLWQAARARCFAIVGTALCHIETSRPMVALTFDDGPTDRGVHAMYRPNEAARRALPLILDGLAAKGLEVVPVGTLLQAGAAPG